MQTFTVERSHTTEECLATCSRTDVLTTKHLVTPNGERNNKLLPAEHYKWQQSYKLTTTRSEQPANCQLKIVCFTIN